MQTRTRMESKLLYKQKWDGLEDVWPIITLFDGKQKQIAAPCAHVSPIEMHYHCLNLHNRDMNDNGCCF